MHSPPKHRQVKLCQRNGNKILSPVYPVQYALLGTGMNANFA